MNKSQRTARLSRKKIDTCVRKAEELAGRGQFDVAAEYIATALEQMPDNPTLMISLAGLRKLEGHLDEAISLVKRALSINKQEPGAQELLLQLYLETGQFEEVIDSGKSFLKSSPRNMYARDIMGVAYLQLGKLDKALQITNELVHLDPTDPGNHFKRAVLFQQKGDLGKAIREFTRVVDLDPEAEIADEARDAISWLDSFQIRQIIGLAIEDPVFKTKLLRDAEEAATEKGFVLSMGGMVTLKHIDFEFLLDPYGDMDQITYH